MGVPLSTPGSTAGITPDLALAPVAVTVAATSSNITIDQVNAAVKKAQADQIVQDTAACNKQLTTSYNSGLTDGTLLGITQGTKQQQTADGYMFLIFLFIMVVVLGIAYGLSTSKVAKSLVLDNYS